MAPPRGNPYPHKYKTEKRTKALDFDTFKEGMNSYRFKKPSRDRSYLAFLYWTGVRRSEAYERVKADFAIKNGILLAKVPAKKHGQRGGSLRVPVDLPFVDLIVKRVKTARKCYHPELKQRGQYLWPMSDTTAWRIVKRVFPQLYPHFFRLNRAVLFCQDPSTSTVDVRSWFGWKSDKTVNFYMGVSERSMIRMGNRLKAE